MGYKMDDLIDASISATEQTGRFFTMSEKTMENMAVTSRAFIGDMRSMGPLLRSFELVGVGADKTLQNINEAGKRALTLGLNTRTTTAELSKNIGKLNEYGFQNGIQGLASMVRKATEFRMEMGEVFKIADKVMSPEGALDLAANLQVLGGAIGALGDPFQMMYMATNNVEGLQDALMGAAKSLVTYNNEQGRFQITGANLRRAREMADQLGVSLDELTNGAVAAMERTSAASDLMASGLQMKDEDKEFLTNLAQMKGGKMVIEVPESLQDQLGKQTEIALDSMTKEQASLLLSQKDAFEKMSMEDVARQQVTLVENIERDVSFLRAVARVNVGKEVGDAIEKMLGVNQKNLSEGSKKLTDKAAASITKGTEGFGVLLDKTEKALGGKLQIGKLETGAEATKLKNEEVAAKTGKTATTAPAETVTKSVVDVNLVSSQAIVDDFYRAMWRDPKWMDDFKKGYLNQNSN